MGHRIRLVDHRFAVERGTLSLKRDLLVAQSLAMHLCLDPVPQDRLAAIDAEAIVAEDF